MSNSAIPTLPSAGPGLVWVFGAVAAILLTIVALLAH